MGRVQYLSGLLLLAFLCGFGQRANGQLPSLQHQEVLNGVPLPTSMVFLPDGRALITSLNGNVWITSKMDQLPVSFDLWLTLDQINNSAEHGLLEILLDPAFASNNYVYLYWSTRQNKNRLSRFVHTTDHSSLLTETVIYETPDQFAGCCHTGGAASFLNDGTIVLSVGDDFDPQLAQDMSSPFGKVHRINSDGSVPVDNPFFDTTSGIYNVNGVLKTIYASGMRNPFRGSYDPVTDRFLIGDVGSNDHTTAWEDIHELSSGANFGWPFCGATGRDNLGNCNDPTYSDPILSYAHEGLGASVMGGCFYRNGNWPAEWEGRYFYGDFVRGWINYLEFDTAGRVIAEVPVVNDTLYPELDAEFIVKMIVGPDGDLYYLILYDDFVSGTGSVHRLLLDSNQLPVCDSIWATPTFGAGPDMLVEFGGSVTDPEGAPLSYTWIFGDDESDASTLNATHTYATFGNYESELIVHDGVHDHSCGHISIEVGQPPLVLITSPIAGSTFRAGDVITFEAQFSDDDPMTVADLEWDIVFNHDTHVHPEADANGIGSYDLIIPTTGHDFTGDTWYTVTVTGTDADGLQTSHSVEVFPEKQNVSILSDPLGMEVFVNSIPCITPYSQDHAIGTELAIVIPNGQQCLAGNGYQFQEWDGGQPGIFLYQIPADSSTLLAQFVTDGACDHCGTAVDFDGIDDFISVDSLLLEGNATIEFWLNLDPGINSSDVILGNDANFSLEMADGKLTVFDNGVQAQSSIITSPNQWGHYALIRSNGEWKIFVNGVLDVNATSVSDHVQDISVTTFGKSFRSQGLDGALDEVRVWNNARSAIQIAQYMSVHVAAFQPSLGLYWRFDQPFGSQHISDLSGNGLNGVAGADNVSDIDEPTFFMPDAPLRLACMREVSLAVKARLDGPSKPGVSLMNDDIRALGYIPLVEPYSALGFSLPETGGDSTTAAVLGVTGSQAVVDWVVVELRDPNDPTLVMHSRVGLLLRNGDIVAPDGVAPLVFSVERPDFNIAVRHRNHFGVMTAASIELGDAGTITVDMRDPNLLMYGQKARKVIGSEAAMWAGNTNGDRFIKYAGADNDRDVVLVGIGGAIPTAIILGYSMLDVNLDGITKYVGLENDRDLILVNIGGSIPTAVKVEQLP